MSLCTCTYTSTSQHTAFHSGYMLLTQTSSLAVHPSVNQPVTLCIGVLEGITSFAGFGNYLVVIIEGYYVAPECFYQHLT